MEPRDFCVLDWTRRQTSAPAFVVGDLARAKLEVERDRDDNIVALRSPDASAGFYSLRVKPRGSTAHGEPLRK